VFTVKRPIICFPAIDWHYLFHRPQQLMTRLALAGHPVHVRNITQIPGAAPEEIAPHLWVYRDFDKLPSEIMQQAIYFIYFPAHAAWITPDKQKFIIYDCIDDDPAFDGHEDLMLRKADLVLCVSEGLRQKLIGRHQQVRLLSNGVDLQHYQSNNGPIPPEMNQIKATGAPIIGFTGAFYQGWVDMELVYHIAHSHPEWRMVIIGESYQWDFGGAPPNLIYLGSRPYSSLPSYLRYFDIGLIPFVDNRISRGADPVKLYEYLAAGIPVISRKLPFVERLEPPLVYAYHNPPECINMIIKALFDNRYLQQPYEQRLSYAAQNTWDQKINLLLGELSKLTNLK
jgi:glycosyltransferase involved in cell wall biosynthesis